MDGPIRITFGVELEFYIRFRPSDYEQTIEQLISDKPQWEWIGYYGRLVLALQYHMINALKEHQIAVNNIDITESNYTKWTVATDVTIQPGIDNPEYGNPDFSFEGIELKSPALLYSAQSVEHISKVISIITQTFKSSVNTSTGFHVHVGNRAAGFPLQTLKNFASLVSVFQRQIHSIHPEDRLDNDFCAAPSTIFRQLPPLEIAKHIYSTSNAADLLDIFLGRGNRFQAYNFDNLREKLKTIEFRQHRGTMDRAEVSNYIHLVCGLICASHLAGPAGFTDLIVRYATQTDSEDYSFLDLLADLQLDRLIPYYSTRLRSHRRLSHEWHPDLKSPETSVADEEDDEELQDVRHPVSECSPEFEMRPIHEEDPTIHEEDPAIHEEDPAIHGELHDETQDPQQFPQKAWASRESEATLRPSFLADFDHDLHTEIQAALQEPEDVSQESVAAPRPLKIANPDADSHPEREEGLEPTEEPDDAGFHANPDAESHGGPQELEDYLQEPEPVSRPLTIANPDSATEGEEDEEPLEEPEEWKHFDWDWREQALRGQHPDSEGLYWLDLES